MIKGNNRIEVWHDGSTRPTDWDGKGQPTAWHTDPPTKWTALVTDIKTGNTYMRVFDDKGSRSEFIKSL